MNRKVATVIVILFLLVMAGVPARADASSKVESQSALSSLPEIEAYLTSIRVDPGSVVVQQGARNYAGPNCPGTEWNCTTATIVVQIASANQTSANVFDCLPAANATFPALNECLIVQSSVLSTDPLAPNTASCSPTTVDDSGKSKTKCTFRQTSKKGNNYAEVRARTTQRGGSPQLATQEADITQTSDGGNNTAKITQTIEQTLNTHQTGPITQKQDARQYAKVTQHSMSGYNSSDVQQNQSQVEDADSQADIDQKQNTESTVGRNAEASVSQTSDTGNGDSTLRQLIKEQQDADTPAGTVSQIQSNSAGGLEGTVAQKTTSLTSPGILSSTSTLDEPQSQDADTQGSLTQVQVGPEFCCATQDGGTEENVNTVTLRNTQHNDTGLLQSTDQDGHCSTTGGGECSVDVTYTSNSGTTHEGDTGPAVNCINGGEGGTHCFVFTPD